MDFSKAFEAMKNGKKVKKSGWNDVYIIFEAPDNFYRFRPSGLKEDWYFGNNDILAEDWEIVEDIQEVKLHIKEYFTCPKCGHENIGFHLDNGVSTCTKCGTRVKTLPRCDRSNKKYGEIVSTYKEYLEKMISGFEDDTKECIASEQYQSAGISTWYKEAYEMCLQALNKIESKTSE